MVACVRVTLRQDEATSGKAAYSELMAIRLFLSSQGLGDNPELLGPNSPSENHALVVLNALDPYPNARQYALPNEMADLASLGYQSLELDLRNHFQRSTDNRQHNRAKTTALTDILIQAHLIWVVGGNTFTLARAMTQSHFKEALASASRTAQHTITYGGYSAGAAVVGPDLQGIDLMDDPQVVPEFYDPVVEAVSLALIEIRIIPHVGSPSDDGNNAVKAIDSLRRAQLDYRTLSDGEVWITNAEMHTSPHRQPE